MRREHEGKAKWMSDKDFRTVGNQAALNHQEKTFVPNYVMRDPSNPPIIHNFRAPVAKDRFVANKPFQLN